MGQQADLFEATTRLEQVLASLEGDMNSPLSGVVHLWGLDHLGLDHADSADHALDVVTLEHFQQVNGESLLGVVQTLAQGANNNPVSPLIWVVTRQAQHVRSADTQIGELLRRAWLDCPYTPLSVLQSPLWGLGRTVEQEHANLWGGLIDLDGFPSYMFRRGVRGEGQSATQPERDTKVLLQKILNPDQKGVLRDEVRETQVAYRNDSRFVARLVKATPPSPLATLPIDKHATYLVTGGLGGLGLKVAQWLATHGANRLILTSRRGITTEEQQTTVRALQDAGVDVQVAQVDVADETAMEQLLTAVATSEKPLKGIFHTAGVLDDAILLNQNWPRFSRVMASKVAGSWLLHTLTQKLNINLDIMVFFSSTASLLGWQGQSNYAAANAFMDGLALLRQQQGLPGLSINWGAFAKVGMAARTFSEHINKAQMLSPEEGVQVLARLWSHAGQVAVMPTTTHLTELPKTTPFISDWVQKEKSVAVEGRRPSLLEELTTLPSAQRMRHLQHHLQQVISRVLGMSDIPIKGTGFAEMGMDSLMALELKQHLDSALHIQLPTTVAFEYPTINALATYLLTEVLALSDVEPLGLSRGTRDHGDITPSISAGSDRLMEPIAVISMACRFPGADTPEAFWQLLQGGVDMVRPVPAERWDMEAYYDPERSLPGKMYVREAAFVDQVDQFDAAFFGISRREATGMDPQHRLLLEVSWETLERAGLAPVQLINSQTGVFVGIGSEEYGALNGIQDVTAIDIYTDTNSGHSVAAGRLAYILGLQGPTLAVDTACSSSLVSLHLACQSLRMGSVIWL